MDCPGSLPSYFREKRLHLRSGREVDPDKLESTMSCQGD